MPRASDPGRIVKRPACSVCKAICEAICAKQPTTGLAAQCKGAQAHASSVLPPQGG